MCSNAYSQENAKVACRQLGLEGGSLVESGVIDANVKSIGSVNCNGEEETLAHCVSVEDEEKCRKLDSLSIECGMPKTSARHIMWGVRMQGTGYTFEPKF